MQNSLTGQAQLSSSLSLDDLENGKRFNLVQHDTFIKGTQVTKIKQTQERTLLSNVLTT